MAKFRSNHSHHVKQSRTGLLRFIFYAIVIVILFYYLYRNFKAALEVKPIQTNIETSAIDTLNNEPENFLPAVSASNELIKHKFYSLSYSERHEQAEWVAYELILEHLNGPKQDRFDYFAPDLSIKSRSAIHRDYTGSGFTRGHLAPAADMAFNPQAAEECFFMSNISPQLRAFNNGIWRELEENVRDWARSNKRIYVVTGPVLQGDLTQKIGQNRVSVPKLFYKVILDYQLPEIKSIGFIIPNARSEQPLKNYACSIDSVEKMTGINFFPLLPDQDKMETIEQQTELQQWPIDDQRFNLRKSKWNKQE